MGTGLPLDQTLSLAGMPVIRRIDRGDHIRLKPQVQPLGGVLPGWKSPHFLQVLASLLL